MLEKFKHVQNSSKQGVNTDNTEVLSHAIYNFDGMPFFGIKVQDRNRQDLEGDTCKSASH